MKNSTLISAAALILVFISGTAYSQGNSNGNNEKITICHYPPGNPDNPQTISIDIEALEAHLAHGDNVGPCDGIIKPEYEYFQIHATPNPGNGHVDVLYEVADILYVDIEIITLYGEVVSVLDKGVKEVGIYSHQVNLKEAGYDSGIFILKASAVKDKKIIDRSMILIESE